ncbi:hypothetical protein I4F81_007426 [Pyropia yezoensis]|uniref:Uncharacterized protein n=1 Tax=Pyropia yezoensis TaxID=2788 RepID=A0ACC3C4I6_PYRYE|nr:hypothetical protein I4F81_007426 [Neopyropia yezoensis]
MKMGAAACPCGSSKCSCSCKAGCASVRALGAAHAKSPISYLSLTLSGAGGLPGGPAADARRASAGGRIASWGALHDLFLADIPGFRSAAVGCLAWNVKRAVQTPEPGTRAAGETAEETAAVRLAVATVVAVWRAVAVGRPGGGGGCRGGARPGRPHWRRHRAEPCVAAATAATAAGGRAPGHRPKCQRRRRGGGAGGPGKRHPGRRWPAGE